MMMLMTAGLLRGGLVPGGVPGQHPRPPPLPLPLHPRHDLRHDLTLTLRQLPGELELEHSRRLKFHNHKEGPYQGLLLVESIYERISGGLLCDCKTSNSFVSSSIENVQANRSPWKGPEMVRCWCWNYRNCNVIQHL